MANSPVTLFMPEQNSSNTRIFSLRHITAFLRLGTLDSALALWLGAILKNKIIIKNEKNMTLNRSQEGHLFTV